MLIKLVRHGQSVANVGALSAQEVGDSNITLTERGHAQAEAVGRVLGAEFVGNALIYCSPYRRTRETLASLLYGAGVDGERERPTIYEDPRLREVEHGYYDYESQQWDRATHGWFYYRFRGGESPADCFDRVSTFLETLMRQVQRKRCEQVLIVSHGLTIRCFAMRFLHLSVEQFEALANPDNCEIVTIGLRGTVPDATHESGRWVASGLRLR